MSISHHDVATAWACQRSASKRGFNMFFDGATIYSYGRHFAIARIVQTALGPVCLFNSEGYSVSTAKHKSIVARALYRLRPGLAVLHVPFVVRDDREAHMANYLDIKRRAAEARDKAKRARLYGPMHLGYAAELDREAWDYALCFGIVEPAHAIAA